MGHISMRNWDLENCVWELIYDPRYGSYQSQSGGYSHQHEVFPTQSGDLYPWFVISTRILHIVLIFMPYFCFSSTTLPSSQNTNFSHPRLSLHAIIMSWHRVQHTPSAPYTECTIHRVQHTPSAAYTECSIHRVQHTPSAAYTECSIHRVQHTPSAAYTECSIHRVQHTPSAVYTECSIHRVQHTPSAAYTQYNIHPVQHTATTAYTEYSIHRVQHTPSIATGQHWFSFLHSHDYILTPEWSFWPDSLYDRPPSARSPWELKGHITLPYCQVCESTNLWI